MKKIFVNLLTFSRIICSLLMPIFYKFLSADIFLVILILVLLTDAFDGFLARLWHVATIFGSLLDKLSDKLLSISIFIILIMKYPFVIASLILELLIIIINFKNVLSGSLGKSSKIGKIKSWIIGVGTILLLGIQLSSNINTKIASNIVSILNKNYIINIIIIIMILSEIVVIINYIFKPKIKSKINYEVKDIKKLYKDNKDYIKKIIFDESYFMKTKNMALIDKLTKK